MGNKEHEVDFKRWERQQPVSSGFELWSGQCRCGQKTAGCSHCMGPALGGRLRASCGSEKALCSCHARCWLRQRKAGSPPWPPCHRGDSGSRGGRGQLGQSKHCPFAQASLSSMQQELAAGKRGSDARFAS